MKIIAADDEQVALEQLTDAIREAAPQAELHSFQKPREMLVYAKENPCDVAFLDVEMGSVTGIEAAKQLKHWKPDINIIFVTGYDKYMADAFKLRVSGYVAKPAAVQDIREELEGLRNPVMPAKENMLVAKCFGTFDAFVNGKSLEFERSKTREMLAYLIDRRGNAVTSGELRAVLWAEAENDDNTGVYLQKLKKDLINTLKKAGVRDVFVTSWNKYAIDPERISCDYYDYLADRPEGVRAYNGEYMSQYSWGELTRAVFERRIE